MVKNKLGVGISPGTFETNVTAKIIQRIGKEGRMNHDAYCQEI